MPELPEVETARRGIAEQLVGCRLLNIELFRPDLLLDQDGLSLDALKGRRLDAVERHGKYLVLHFEAVSAVIHLKLAGQLVARGEGIPGFAAGHPVPAFDAPLPHKSTHLRFDFDCSAHGATLYLTDIRHFASVWLLHREDVPEFIANLKLGLDVTDPAFSVAVLKRQLARRKTGKLKPTLLNQQVVAGLGNIYVDESLWQAKLHPERVASSLKPAELKRLYDGIQTTMSYALPIGGAKVLNGKALPEIGEFPFVHGREGQPCQRCGTTIIKTRVDGRGTYLCPRCQRLPKAATPES